MYAAAKDRMMRAAFMAAGRPIQSRLLAGSPALLHELGLVHQPRHTCGVRSPALEAFALVFATVTAVEFGVAGGTGLLALEGHAV